MTRLRPLLWQALDRLRSRRPMHDHHEAIVVPADVLADAVAHLRRALPAEGVGLFGAAVCGERTQATRFYPGVNVDASPTRYTMRPEEVLAALLDLDRQGWCLGAIVHSHPRTLPLPSPTDLREARYPDALLVIVGFAAEPPTIRAWRLVDADGSTSVREVPVVVADNGAGTAAVVGRNG